MSVPTLTDLLDRALGRLLWQWRHGDETNMQRLVRIAVGQLLPLRDAIVALVEERTLDAAVGAQLDQWGTVLALPRGGRSDSAYRVALRARLAVYLSDGTPERLIGVLRLLVGPVVVELVELYPARVVVQYARPVPTTDEERSSIVEQLREAAPAGVALEVVEATPSFFGFAGDDEALGFDEGELAFRLH